MKKRDVRSLQLVKKTITNFNLENIKGGWSTRTKNHTTARTVRGCD